MSQGGVILAFVKNGTNAAILVTDLLRADGPAAGVAEDFIAARCSLCARRNLEDMRFHHDGYVCSTCGVPTSEVR